MLKSHAKRQVDKLVMFWKWLHGCRSTGGEMGSKSGEVTCTEHGKPIGLLISQEKVSLSQERPNGL